MTQDLTGVKIMQSNLGIKKSAKLYRKRLE